MALPANTDDAKAFARDVHGQHDAGASSTAAGRWRWRERSSPRKARQGTGHPSLQEGRRSTRAPRASHPDQVVRAASMPRGLGAMKRLAAPVRNAIDYTAEAGDEQREGQLLLEALVANFGALRLESRAVAEIERNWKGCPRRHRQERHHLAQGGNPAIWDRPILEMTRTFIAKLDQFVNPLPLVLSPGDLWTRRAPRHGVCPCGQPALPCPRRRREPRRLLRRRRRRAARGLQARTGDRSRQGHVHR